MEQLALIAVGLRKKGYRMSCPGIPQDSLNGLVNYRNCNISGRKTAI